ncbi:HNH/ENDO VII family nuclease [Fusobacterium varium]|uniref:HNH/ENDO VII family nuclease n=1 Tax=Fusobacterium varium TaxID=856 RepID=UPI00356956A7
MDFKFHEVKEQDSPLLKLTVEKLGTKEIDVKELDKSLVKEINNKNLSAEEKEMIKEETAWSDEIIDSIGSIKEYEVYKEANLSEAEKCGKKCLIRSDIDGEQKDSMGRTNIERGEQGLAPINIEGKKIELHHIGQRADSPLAELTKDEHIGNGNDIILHDKTKESEIDRRSFDNERMEYWKEKNKGVKE